ncbi:synaptic vesicle glycoprotein 2B-like [Anopheles nili]|uniref:synaptic vesicle glycoprotein 2B-like n=1 Tax=Anopheles nili TaxID=185578 RepID=UPI00237A4BC9|nr:synaptic vesicle glycoprotein 2B-like [Anopheles nili]
MEIKGASISLPGMIGEERKHPYSHSLDEALELTGFGRAQIVLLFLSGVCLMTVVNEAIGIGIILPKARCDLNINPWEEGIVGGAIFLGVMISSYFWGYLADTRGRQIILKWALFATSFFAAISCLASGFTSLLVLRFLTGVCVAAPASTVYAYLGEFTTPSRRSQMLSFASVWGGVGIVYVSLVGWWILSYDWAIAITDSFEFKPWRLLFIINTLPAFLNGIAFCFCPESPKFLVSQGRNEEALEVLKKVYQINKGASNAEGYEVTTLRLDPEDALAREQNGGDHSVGLFKSMLQQTAPIVKLPYLVYFIICCVHNIGAFAIYGGLGLWFPDIMNQVLSHDPERSFATGQNVCSLLHQHHPQATRVDLCKDEAETYLYTITLGLISMVQGFFTSLTLSGIEPKMMIMVNFTVSGICGVALEYVTASYMVAILFCVEIVFAGYCTVLVNANVISIFSTSVRATAVALTSIFGRLSGFVASSVIGGLILAHCSTTVFVLSSFVFASAGISLILPNRIV